MSTNRVSRMLNSGDDPDCVMSSVQPLCVRDVNPLECKIALSSFLEQDSATCQLPPPVDITAEEENHWNGRRITVFGDASSGVSSLCNMFSDVSATMSDSRKKSNHLGPLTLKVYFDSNEDDPLVCVELEGIGHPRKETMKPMKELLSMFPTWSFLCEPKEAACERDLVALRNDLMLFLQDVDDVFAIRLGFVLSDTVVIVHDGHDLCKIQEQVNEYLDHFNAVPTRDNDVVSDYRGLVRKTTNIFVVVNFAHGSFKVNYESFHHWTEKEEFRCYRRKPRGLDIIIRLYSKAREACGARSAQCKVTYVSLFRDPDPESRKYNSAVVAYIKQNTVDPQYDTELESLFQPVEIAARLLLPSFCNGKRPIVRIAKSDIVSSEDCTTYKVFTSGTQNRKQSVMMLTRYQGPDHNSIGYLQRVTEKHPEIESLGHSRLFTATVSKGSNTGVKKLQRVSSGKVTFFHIWATYGDPGCRRLYSKLVELPGLFTYDYLTKSTEKVVVVFKKDDADSGCDSD